MDARWRIVHVSSFFDRQRTPGHMAHWWNDFGIVCDVRRPRVSRTFRASRDALQKGLSFMEWKNYQAARLVLLHLYACLGVIAYKNAHRSELACSC